MSIGNWREALLARGATIGDAVRSLDHSGLQIVLVMTDEERLAGTITDGDIRRGLLRGLGTSDPAQEVMQNDPMVVPPNLDRQIVLQIMSANKIHQLPIVDKTRRVTGLHVWDEMQAPLRRSSTMVVMAGGKGTRLRPLTENCPKPLLPVSGKPMLEHIVERAKGAGIERFVFSVHYLGHMIEDHFGDGSEWDVSIDYIREESPLGTGGALSLMQDRPVGPFLVTNGDVMTDIAYGDMIDYHVLHSATATMAVRNHEMRNEFGVVHTNGLDISGFEEKPVIRSHVNAGIYVIDPQALDSLSYGEHCDMPTLFERLRRDGRRTIVFPLHERWLDVGRPDDLALADAAASAK
ncbi:MAG: nucleotidyltransferase family protein [Pseudomonadota bacterium]|jgi:dTDP-glucose pyrophosphorylase|nr:nucleotidyltransferase family protein [Pseudomonadota bacterium]